MTHPTQEPLSNRIVTIRGHRVILDADLARLYGVPTFRFNEAVKRNAKKFPDDFRFQLTRGEAANLKFQFVLSNTDVAGSKESTPDSSQIAMSSRHRGGTYLAWAFTEHGALMAATVLNSPRAVSMSLFVIRAFVRMREELAASATIFERLAAIDKTLLQHDAALLALWQKLQPLLAPPPSPSASFSFSVHGLKSAVYRLVPAFIRSGHKM
jgi:hypothetical protein